MTEDQTQLWAFSSPLVIQRISIFPDGSLVEDYVKEFLELSNLVPWNDGTMKIMFWRGLNDHLYQQIPASATTCSLESYSDYVLWLSYSSLNVGI